MRKKLLIVLFISLITIQPNSYSQTYRALLIGINEYNFDLSKSKYRKGFSNLKGPINDILAIENLIVNKYLFPQENIVKLINEEGTRDNIIKELKKLAEISNSGDVVLIYYSGHGSQVVNSLSNELDKKDETIVPYDSYLGVPDIRDKELSVFLNGIIDKGAILTCIFDCCHSGSVTRGITENYTPTYRYAPMIEDDIADLSDPPDPSERGALILTACLEYEKAREKEFENNITHGVLTYSLLKILNSDYNETAENILKRLQAFIFSKTCDIQHPQMNGVGRMDKTIFGKINPNYKGETYIPVKDIDKNEIILNGGYVNNLNKGCELIKKVEKEGAKEIRLKITEILGLTQSKAILISGSYEEIEVGDLFILDKWTKIEEPNLYVKIQKSDYTKEELQKIAEELNKLKNENNIKIISDPTEENFNYILYYENEWILSDTLNNSFRLGYKPAKEKILKLLGDKKNIKLYVNYPLTKENYDKLYNLYSGEYNSIEITNDPLKINYILSGKYEEDKLEYSWILRNIIEVNPTEFHSTLPHRSDWISIDTNNFEDLLAQKTGILGKVMSWLTLLQPTGSDPFPYKLGIMITNRNTIVEDGGILHNGDRCEFILIRDEEKMKKYQKFNRNHDRYIYIIGVSPSGTTILYYPKNENVNNKFPYFLGDSLPKVYSMNNGKPIFEITPPYGNETFILIATSEKIENPKRLENPGVRKREYCTNVLEDLFCNLGAKNKRGGYGEINIPVSWTIQRLNIRSTE